MTLTFADKINDIRFPSSFAVSRTPESKICTRFFPVKFNSLAVELARRSSHHMTYMSVTVLGEQLQRLVSELTLHVSGET